MKTVLYPAIALMNRLSFGMKFGLISVLFFLPLLITSFYLVRDAYRQFSDTRIELQSLTLLGSGLQIRRGLESLNDLLQINAVIGQSGKAGDLEARIADVQKGLRGRLEALAPLSEDGAAVAEFEAQRDRFMARISMGYPDSAAELEMLRSRDTSSPLDAITPVVTGGELASMIGAARNVFASRAVEQYAVAIAQATRADRDLRLGASPRATLQLVRAAKARAALDGREFVLPDDIDALAVPVLGHRLIASRRVSGTSLMSGGAVADILARIIADTPVPLSSAGPA